MVCPEITELQPKDNLRTFAQRIKDRKESQLNFYAEEDKRIQQSTNLDSVIEDLSPKKFV